MTSTENPSQSPEVRSREVLRASAINAREHAAITKLELGALSLHLGFQADDKLSYDKRSKIDEYLAHIGEKIRGREDFLKDRRFVMKRLANTGLLAAAVGNLEKGPMSRSELLALEVIDQLAVKNPKVNRNVFVDLWVANDLDWLCSPTKPINATHPQ